MKFKLLRRRLSIGAPRMTIRTHIPWPVRAAAVVLMSVAAIALVWWVYEAGRRFSGLGVDYRAEAERLQKQVREITAERDRLLGASNAVESRFNIERTTKEQLAQQAKSLEIENARLKDDVAFFESVSGGLAAAAGVTIKRFQIEPDTVPDQMRYRILLVKGGKPGGDFTGDLQFVLALQRDGNTVMMTLPRTGVPGGRGPDAAPYRISFRLYKRIEGSFAIPPGSILKEAQVRVLENGAVRAQQVVVLN